MISWENITVRQFQQINAISNDNELTEGEKDLKILAISYGMTEDEVSNLSWDEYHALQQGLSFLDNTPVPDKRLKRFKVNGRYYRIVYDVREVNAARYIEVQTFQSRGIIENLHRIAASIVIPQKYRWLRFVDQKYNAEEHKLYADDMLDLPFHIVYSSCVFFYAVFTTSIHNLKDYLSAEIAKTAPERVKELRTALSNITDGSMIFH